MEFSYSSYTFSRNIYILVSSSENNKVEKMYNNMGFVDDEMMEMC